MKLIKKYLGVLLFFGLLVSCETNVVEKPENLIGEDEMVDIFYDVAVLNAVRSSNVNILRDHNIQPEEFLYEKYHIDSLQLAKSSVYYASKPNVHLRIFKTVEERLEEEKKLADSLMRIKREKGMKEELNNNKRDSVVSEEIPE